MVAFTRFFERVDRHCGVLARIDFGDLGGEIAASAVGVFAHQHVDARSRLGHDEQTAVRQEIDVRARTQNDLHGALHPHAGGDMNEQTVLNKEGVEARHDVALLPIGVLVLIGGFVMRRPIVVAFEPFGVLGGRLAEGEQLHPFGQLHLTGRGHHHVVDHVDGHGGQVRNSATAVVAGAQPVERVGEIGGIVAGKERGGIGVAIAFGFAVRKIDAGEKAPRLIAVPIEGGTAVRLEEGALVVKETKIRLETGHGETVLRSWKKRNGKGRRRQLATPAERLRAFIAPVRP